MQAEKKQQQQEKRQRRHRQPILLCNIISFLLGSFFFLFFLLRKREKIKIIGFEVIFLFRVWVFFLGETMSSNVAHEQSTERSVDAVCCCYSSTLPKHFEFIGFSFISFQLYTPINAYIIIEPHAAAATSCSQCCVYKNKSLPFAVVSQFNRHGIENMPPERERENEITRTTDISNSNYRNCVLNMFAS